MFEDGFEIIDNFISEEERLNFTRDIENIEFIDGIGGIRNVEKKLTSVSDYLQSSNIYEKAALYLKGEPKFVRAILFNKTPQNNWLVTWHQDKTVAVSASTKPDGWGPWSTKDGVLHVQPPLEVLNEMIAIRIHIDASTDENGCLKVLPKTHELGIVSPEEVSQLAANEEAISCVAKRGSALVMRPHVLHSSSKGANPSQRRVLHLEFSSYCLPKGISWA